jgi:hypothetical protein
VARNDPLVEACLVDFDAKARALGNLYRAGFGANGLLEDTLAKRVLAAVELEVLRGAAEFSEGCIGATREQLQRCCL